MAPLTFRHCGKDPDHLLHYLVLGYSAWVIEIALNEFLCEPHSVVYDFISYTASCCDDVQVGISPSLSPGRV